MLLIDECRPTNVNQMFFHKEIFDLLTAMSSDDALPHIIFYGSDDVNSIIKLFLQMIFDKSVHNIKNVAYKVTGSGNKITSEIIKQSNYHIEIDPKTTNFDRYLIHDIVKEYAKRKSIGAFETNKSFKVILINNLDNMLYYAQTALRRTMERYNDKCRFIMWCRSLSKVIKPLQSRCICIRVPSPNDKELFRYIFDVSTKRDIYINPRQCNEIVNDAHGNIKKALWGLEVAKHNITLKTDYIEALNEIINLYLQKSLQNMTEIRRLFFNLMITNINKTTIFSDLLDAICECHEISDKAKQKIIHSGARIEHRLANSRRDIIHFDLFSITTMKIINENP